MTDSPVSHAAYRRDIHKHAKDALSRVEIEDLWEARIPTEYVNALQPAYASNIIECHRAGVPADYASAFSAKWRQPGATSSLSTLNMSRPNTQPPS